MVFEHHSERMLSARAFALRLARFTLLSSLLVGFSLALGSWGYHRFGELPWIDALLNASMILTGMGPVDRMETDAGKLFSTAYALFSGLVFLTTATLLVAPILHRMLHALHVEPEDGDRGEP